MAVIGFPYVRYSDPRQGTKDKDSERRQWTWCQETAARCGYVLDDSHKLRDRGKSGFHEKNVHSGDLGRFLRLVEEGAIPRGSVLLFEEWDRFSRARPHKARRWRDEVLEGGVNIHTSDGLMTEADLDDLPKTILADLKHHEAHSFSKKQSVRLSAKWSNWRKMISAGQKVPPPGQMPPWVDWDGGKSAFILREKEASAVRLLVRLAGDGLGIRRIAAQLVRDGIPTIGNSGSWCISYIAKLLSTRMVLGDLVDADGVVHAGFYPALVDEDTLLRVQGALGKRQIGQKGVGRGGKDGVANLLTGLVRDAVDGEVMHLHGKGGTGSKKLFSAGTQHPGRRDGFVSIPYDLLEEAVLRLVLELKIGDVVGDKPDEDLARLGVLDGKIAALQAQIDGERVRQEARRKEGKTVSSATMGMLDDWGDELELVKKERGEVSARLACAGSRSLVECQEAVRQVMAGDGQRRIELRLKCMTRLRALVEAIWVLVWKVDASHMAADVQVFVGGGRIRTLFLTWAARGRRFQALGHSGGVEGLDVPGMDYRRLDVYRTDVDVESFYGALHYVFGERLRTLWRETHGE
jgi:hypothetical protein